ncbi:helix-turn-helix transcriptional regulator [Glycomyces amatae]|uniref:helix-turn-helix transcriptional regulator n=1 Tax=Glycomyces amatae TaxID=2881355 RepID=UPI003F721F71
MAVGEILRILADEDGRPLPRRTWQQWRADGKAPPAIRLPNGQLRIRRADFEAWLAGLSEPKEEP